MSDATAEEMPLADVLQALSRTPVSQAQLRAALATTCARWHLVRSEHSEAIRQLGHALEMVPDLRPAMRLLYRIYLDRGDVRSAVMYLDQEIRATRHPREAAALYRERGLLVEAHFNDLSAALQCYQAALKATPRDLALLRSVERVSLARGDVFWLIANLEAQLEVVQDPVATAALYHGLALLEARHKGDLALAGDLLLGALEVLPDHAVLVADLFRVAEVAGDGELMLRALELEAGMKQPGARAMLLARASVTLREHRDRAGALTLLLAAARDQPHNVSLWRSLEELAMATSRHEVALEACVGQLRAVGDAEEASLRAELYYRVGKLALFRLDRPVEGLASMRKALRLNPAHVPALEDTGRFLGSSAMWAQLFELMQHEIGSAATVGMTSEELALAHLRAGQLMEERLGELEGARRHYESAIAAHPTYRPARDRLERLLHQVGDVEGLRAHYAAELEAAKTPARKLFLLSVLSQLHASLEDPGPAIKLLVTLLKQQADHLPSIQLLARLLARADKPKELARITEQEIGVTKSPGRKAKLLHRTGELALGLGERDRARALFERALEVVDDHLPSLTSLEDLLREAGDFSALVELLRKEQLYANDRARQAALQLEVATLLSTRLDRKDEALVELESLLARWPRHLPALHAAESLAASTGRTELLLALLEQHIAAVAGPRTRALLLHRTAVLRNAHGDGEGAIRDLVRALELWPQLGVARARLLRLYEQHGRSRELQAFAEAGLTSERGADDRRAMALQLAELSPRPVVAIQYLSMVAEARPEDYVTQLRLARSCHQAGRPSREAGALDAAAKQFAEQLAADDPMLLALRYRAARAAEGAGNLDAADGSYAQILDVAPSHTLARRGRLRIKERKRDAASSRSAGALDAAADAAKNPIERAACLVLAAEQHERRADLDGALARADAAIAACADYLPAWHARARVLERRAGPEDYEAAAGVYESIATRLREGKHRAPVLCRAGLLALRSGTPGQANPRACIAFAGALAADPGSEQAFRGLRHVRDTHGTEGAPPLAELLTKRLGLLRAAKTLTPSSLRDIARLALDVDGAEAAARVIEAGLDVAKDDAGTHADLAQTYARLERWPETVRELEAALARESSPERRAALHYYAADAHARAGKPAAAIDHYMASAHGGFHPRHALAAADRLAETTGATRQRVAALESLVEIADGPERARSLRALAQIHRAELGEPEVAVERMRELLLLRPTDVDVVTELRRLLEELGRSDEAAAAMLASVAHHRAWLRSAASSSGRDEPFVEPVSGLSRLFESLGETDGLYITSAVLEQVAPEALAPGRRCDELLGEPWPLPKPQEGRPFEGLIGDLPQAAALDLLREGVFYLSEIPPRPTVDLSPSRSLPSNSPVVIVVRALANAMGVPQPLAFVDPQADDDVVAVIGATPALLVGRRLSAAPLRPSARDRIGRALFRLSTGGDGLHRSTPAQLSALLVSLCRGAGVVLDPAPPHDEAYAAAVAKALAEPPSELQPLANAFKDGIDGFDAAALTEALAMAEDRAGAVCAADPRAALERLRTMKQLSSSRGIALVGYLVSDDHLALRRALGYQVEMNAPSRAPEGGT